MDPETKTVKPKTKKDKVAKVYDAIEIVAVAVVIVLLLFTFIGRLSTVEGDSMYDTLENGERLIISNFFYKPKSGDIIVFQQSGMYFDEPLVKRVIATEGQTVKIDFDAWLVWVDGSLLNETYVTHEKGKRMKVDNYDKMYADIMNENGEITIPKGYLFVMGDNRNHSSDSRFSGVGLVRVEDVMGRVVFRLFPHFGLVG